MQTLFAFISPAMPKFSHFFGLFVDNKSYVELRLLNALYYSSKISISVAFEVMRKPSHEKKLLREMLAPV